MKKERERHKVDGRAIQIVDIKRKREREIITLRPISSYGRGAPQKVLGVSIRSFRPEQLLLAAKNSSVLDGRRRKRISELLLVCLVF